MTPGLGAFFKSDELARRGFRAAIFEGDFRDADHAVSDLCRDQHDSLAHCLNIDPERPGRAFRFIPTHENLLAVRTHYHMPSYAVFGVRPHFIIVSDSDYFWGLAGAPRLVDVISTRNAQLRQTRADVRPFLDSGDSHDRRIGAMLSTFHDVCDAAAAIV